MPAELAQRLELALRLQHESLECERRPDPRAIKLSDVHAELQIAHRHGPFVHTRYCTSVSPLAIASCRVFTPFKTKSNPHRDSRAGQQTLTCRNRADGSLSAGRRSAFLNTIARRAWGAWTDRAHNASPVPARARRFTCPRG